MNPLNSISLPNLTHAQFPFPSYPEKDLSSRRSDALAKFNTLANQPEHATPELFRTFLSDFTRMGWWDVLADLFLRSGAKREILNAVAICHVASFPAGREFLWNAQSSFGDHSFHEHVVLLVTELDESTRAHMLGNPTLGEDGMILMSIGDTGLHLPLTSVCLDCPGLLSHEAVANMLLAKDDTSRTLLGRVADSVASERKGVGDATCNALWYALLAGMSQCSAFYDAAQPSDVRDLATVYLSAAQSTENANEIASALSRCARLLERKEDWGNAAQMRCALAAHYADQASDPGMHSQDDSPQALTRVAVHESITAARCLEKANEARAATEWLQRAQGHFDQLVAESDFDFLSRTGERLYAAYGNVNWPEAGQRLAADMCRLAETRGPLLKTNAFHRQYANWVRRLDAMF
ncbi:hypothetical protein [Pandoraea vervacti]|nr:hypothetical protein [Pandoraea vervacti]